MQMSLIDMFQASGWVAKGVILILLVLVQPSRDDGMAGAFGGMGGSVAFGVKTLDVLWKATIVFAVIFMGTALGLTILDKHKNRPMASPGHPAAPTP